MMLFDSHCHLTDYKNDADFGSLVDEIRSSELKYLVDIGTSLESSRRCVQTAHEFEFCYAAVGVFPSETYDMTDSDLEALRQLSRDPRVVAIGEIGLDYHYEDTNKEKQQYWFARQVTMAIEEKLPIAIHSRDADGDTLRLLGECGAFSPERTSQFPRRPDGRPDARVMLHCYSGSAQLARTYEMLGATISLAGPVTFKNARRSVEVAAGVDIRNLLIETDAPYLTPVPFRGTRNKPTYVRYTAEKIAAIRGNSYDFIVQQTFENACRFYGIDPLA